MYEEHVLEHFRNPYHKSSLPPASLSVYSGKSVSEVCGDQIEIYVCIRQGVIKNICWQGEGCCFSQAAASMLAEYADGKTLDEMRQFDTERMFALFQVECPSARQGCVLVALHALRDVLHRASSLP